MSVELHFTEPAVRHIAAVASARRCGARGLRSMVEGQTCANSLYITYSNINITIESLYLSYMFCYSSSVSRSHSSVFH